MQKNWYAVYTRPHCEKKIAATLSKKKIENFCPLNYTKVKFQKRSKILQKPLFGSYVFVYITQNEVSYVKQVDGVINLLYWKGMPAIIKEDEIKAIKEFTNNHQDIKLEQAQVNLNDVAYIIEGPSFSTPDNFFALKTKIVKVHLPSLGYNMIAKREEESIFSGELNILQNNSFVHSQ